MRASGSESRQGARRAWLPRSLPGAVLWAVLPCAGALPARGARESLPCLRQRVAVREQALEIDAGKAWAKGVVVPRFSRDEVPVLALRARVRTPLPGGCNYVLQVLIHGLPLSETPMRPRLLNKAPWFEPPGTQYHFSWYGASG